MIEIGLKEAARIHDELAYLERIVSSVKTDWEKFVHTGDGAYLKAAAYDLHGFYSGIERVFQSIADTIDDHVPDGDKWHKDLLGQMSQEIENVRPALITEESVRMLDEYVRFRHRIRNIYSFNLIPERVEGLVGRLPSVYQQVRSDLIDFAHFLEQLSESEKANSTEGPAPERQ